MARHNAVAKETAGETPKDLAKESAKDFERGGIDFGPLADWIGFHLRMAQFAAFQAYANRTRQLDLSPGRFSALAVIGHNPGLSQTQLSQAIGSDKSTLTPAIEALVRRGLVRRSRMPQDKRVYRLHLTAAGEKMLRELTACAVAHERELDAIVGPRERTQFLRALQRISEKLG